MTDFADTQVLVFGTDLVVIGYTVTLHSYPVRSLFLPQASVD